MKLSKFLLFATIVAGINANAASPSNATCPHGDKSALVKNKSADLSKVDMVLGVGKTPAPKSPGSGTTARR